MSTLRIATTGGYTAGAGQPEATRGQAFPASEPALQETSRPGVPGESCLGGAVRCRTHHGPTDTFLETQGTGQPQDTMGYSGVEPVDTTGGAVGQNDTTAVPVMDTPGTGCRDAAQSGRGAMDSATRA
jgi:hypothetical protein